MVPDPHCASCNGTFVEKIEDPADDPREFHRNGPAFANAPGFAGDANDPMDALLSTLFAGLAMPPRPRSPRSSAGVSFQFSSGGLNGGPRVIRIGGPNTLGGGGPSVPTLSEFLRSPHTPAGPTHGPPEDPTIPGQLMARYLASLLSRMGGGHPLSGMMPDGEEGRMGDYVFTQEALDRILTQLMEGDSHRPVPASAEVIDKLQRDVLEEGSPLLDKDCAVCKEQFQLGTEDPDEQVVVTLPCHHPFHHGCISPWLKSSGTCPVCRYQLVPQPEQHGPGERPSGSRSASPSSRTGSPPGQPAPSNIFASLFGGSGSGGSARPSTSRQSGSGGAPGGGHQHVPGEWDEPDLD